MHTKNEEMFQRCYNDQTLLSELKHLDFFKFEKESREILPLINKENIVYIILPYEQLLKYPNIHCSQDHLIDLSEFPNLEHVHILCIPMSKKNQRSFAKHFRDGKYSYNDMYEELGTSFYYDFIHFSDAYYNGDIQKFCKEILHSDDICFDTIRLNIFNCCIDYIEDYTNPETIFYVECYGDMVNHECSFYGYCKYYFDDLDINIGQILEHDFEDFYQLYESDIAYIRTDWPFSGYDKELVVYNYSHLDHVKNIIVDKTYKLTELQSLHEFVVQCPNLTTIKFNRSIEMDTEEFEDNFLSDETTFDMPYHFKFKNMKHYDMLKYFTNVKSLTIKHIHSPDYVYKHNYPDTSITLKYENTYYEDYFYSRKNRRYYKEKQSNTYLTLIFLSRHENITIDNEIFHLKKKLHDDLMFHFMI